MSYDSRLTTKRSFTLIELMVAVVVLLVVMVAVGRIFSTTSDVSATGVAISETLQQAVAIEQQLREDIAKISSEGFFAIRHVAVPNNIYQYILVDDSQPPSAIIRFDQLVFIRLGITSPVGLYSSGNGDFAGQTFASLVYYGHGVSFPRLTSEYVSENTIYSEDPSLLIVDDVDPVITPWYQGVLYFNTRQYTGSQYTIFDDLGFDGTTNGTQQLPSRWMLCRQSTALGDDDQYDRDAAQKNRYVSNGLSTHTIFPSDPRFVEIYPHVVNGRVDIVSTHLGDIRQSVITEVETGNGTGGRWWRMFENPNKLDQQELIASLLQWPRVEALPPSSDRYDQMLMMNGLVQGCISFQVEWTYDENTGMATDFYGNDYPGYEYPDYYSQPWWGAASRENPDDPSSTIYFETLTDYHSTSVTFDDWYNDNYDPDVDHVAARSVNPSIIETVFSRGEGPQGALIPVVSDASLGITEYWSIFGYNGTEPFMENQIDFLNDGIFSFAWRYTPRPSALRITLRMLDRDSRLGSGWTYQFVVDLPEMIR